jgi:hypothetical protein
MVTGIVDVSGPASPLASSHQREPAALWRSTLLIEDPARKEAGRSERDLKVMEYLTLSENDTFVMRSKALVVDGQGVLALRQVSKRKDTTLVAYGPRLANDANSVQHYFRRAETFA